MFNRFPSCRQQLPFDASRVQPLAPAVTSSHMLSDRCSNFRRNAFTSTLSAFFPTFGVGLLDVKFNSSPRPELFFSPGLLLDTPGPNPREPWSAQPQRLPEGLGLKERFAEMSPLSASKGTSMLKCALLCIRSVEFPCHNFCYRGVAV